MFLASVGAQVLCDVRNRLFATKMYLEEKMRHQKYEGVPRGPVFWRDTQIYQGSGELMYTLMACYESLVEMGETAVADTQYVFSWSPLYIYMYHTHTYIYSTPFGVSSEEDVLTFSPEENIVGGHYVHISTHLPLLIFVAKFPS
mgnify:FL=1